MGPSNHAVREHRTFAWGKFMKKLSFCGWALLLALCMSVPAFSQGGFFAAVSGTVTDASKALIPGVSVKATAVDTGIVTDAVSNESGSYNFSNLAPGRYTLSASLPGFQTRTLTDVNLSQNTTSRYNFELTVSGVNTQVEVQVSADTILASQGASIGTVLNEQRIRDLPLVGNNVLNLITVLAGIENIAADNAVFGREATTFAGVSAQNVSIVRDGIQVQDNRYPNGINSVTTINPDLVGEIRLILTPVDVEIGRGNGTIQYSTRSGTNRYSGSAVWSFRNTALDPNTWVNNRNQTVPVGSPAGTLPVATVRNWSNVHQGTISFGGPIVRNKTFFFGLFDIYANRSRALTTVSVPTPCARLGIFRYFNGWGNGNLFTNKNETSPANAVYPSVLADGTPINPMNNGATTPGGLPPGWNPNTPYDPSLQYISVFGKLQSNPTTADCSDAPINMTTLVPNGVNIASPSLAADGSNGWDLFRKQMDPTGFMAKQLAISPAPNYFGGNNTDGLNTASYRLLNSFRGLDNLFGVGEGTGDRTQYNVKVDHNFSSNHKANVNVTYERVSSDDIKGVLDGMVSNTNFRRPTVVSMGFTSTLSSTLLNEARFGMRRQGTNVVAPWDRNDPEIDARLEELLPARINGFLVIPNMAAFGFCIPYFGGRPPGGCGGVTDTARDRTPTNTYADTLSWTKGAHAFKFGGELRSNSSETTQTATGFFGTPMYARPTGGTITGTTQPTTGGTAIAGTNPNMAFLTNAAPTGGVNGNAANARTLANYLAGSLGNVQHLFIVTSPDQIDFDNPANNTWSDFRTQEFTGTKIVQKEFNAFFKDDFKISRNWTLNLGVRWDYFGVPYLESGLTNRVIGGLAGAFGVSGSSFDDWMQPGIRADVSKFEFVGKNSPNPGETLYPNDYNNFSPGVGFAWQVPWFGEGRTTVRGGYQVTYQGGGRYNTLQPFLAGAPGNSLAQQSNWTNVYKDLTNVDAALLPLTPSVLPLQPVPLDVRTATYTPFDDNYVAPYVQNLNLSVTRSMNRYVTLDVRYVGTLSRKQFSTTNLNTANFLYNGLLEELQRVRTGTEITKTASDPKSLLDKMFQGINLCAAAGSCSALPAGQSFGAVGTTTGTGLNAVYQSAALQMRSRTTFQSDLANGDFPGIADTLSDLNYSTAGVNASLPAIAPGTVGAVLRYANTNYPGQFPDNFVVANPQFNNVNLQNNNGYSNYHSLQVQTSIRPIHGLSGQFTYSWSKNLGLGAITDPTNRAADYTNINSNPTHSLRTNGTIELPIGPNKLLLGNSSGFLARALERWQLGLIYNLTSGAPVSITATTMLYGNGVPDVVYPVDFNKLKEVRWGTVNGAFLEGRYFDNNDTFVKVDDPVCGTVTSLQNLNNVVNGVQTRCSLNALAMAVPAGTAGAIDREFADGQIRPSVIVLQHAQPGKKGNLGNNTIIGLGSYRFDANLGKTFQISESKSVQVRFDAQNVLNHPQPATPTFSITGNDYFGRIATKAGGRALQGQLRFSF